MRSSKVEIPPSLLTSMRRGFGSSSLRHQVNLAWAAGLFIGEGNSTSHRPRGDGLRHPIVQIGMNDMAAVLKFAAIMGPYAEGRTRGYSDVPFIRGREYGVGKTHYTYRVSGNVAARVLSALLPYLEGTEKGAQAKEVLSRAPRT